jgi:alanine racemase
MDQILVNCADDAVGIGDEVVLIGTQGSELITANEWANKIGTIGYEIVCAISARMPRNYIN